MQPTTSTYTHTVSNNQPTGTSIGNCRYTMWEGPITKATEVCPFSGKRDHESSKWKGASVGNERYAISNEPLPRAFGVPPSQKGLHALFKKNVR